MDLRRSTTALVAVIALSASSALAQGTTVLTFDITNPTPGNGQLINQDYGDRVTAALVGVSPQFSYGGGSGFTPHVTTLYDGGSNGPQFWGPQYGDLTNVIYGEQGQLLLVTFTPDPGFTVSLNSFDLAGWPDTDYTINSVQVFTGGGGPAFAQNDVLVRGATTNGNGQRRTSFSFNNITSTGFLLIQIDALNLAGASDNIGIDNISFSQSPTVAVNGPEPA
jgi:hypothetical protein